MFTKEGEVNVPTVVRINEENNYNKVITNFLTVTTKNTSLKSLYPICFQQIKFLLSNFNESLDLSDDKLEDDLNIFNQAREQIKITIRKDRYGNEIINPDREVDLLFDLDSNCEITIEFTDLSTPFIDLSKIHVCYFYYFKFY